MESTKYIGMDVHKESISLAVRNAAGKVVVECVIETKANMILQFVDGLRRDVHVTFEEGTWAALAVRPAETSLTRLVVCDPRRNALLQEGNQNDRVDARKLTELLQNNLLRSVYHGDHGAMPSGQFERLDSEQLTSGPALTRGCNRAVVCAGNIAHRNRRPTFQWARFLHSSFGIEQPARGQGPIQTLRGTVVQREFQGDLVVHGVLANPGRIHHRRVDALSNVNRGLLRPGRFHAPPARQSVATWPPGGIDSVPLTPDGSPFRHGPRKRATQLSPPVRVWEVPG